MLKIVNLQSRLEQTTVVQNGTLYEKGSDSMKSKAVLEESRTN